MYRGQIFLCPVPLSQSHTSTFVRVYSGHFFFLARPETQLHTRVEKYGKSASKYSPSHCHLVRRCNTTTRNNTTLQVHSQQATKDNIQHRRVWVVTSTDRYHSCRQVLIGLTGCQAIEHQSVHVHRLPGATTRQPGRHARTDDAE